MLCFHTLPENIPCGCPELIIQTDSARYFNIQRNLVHAQTIQDGKKPGQAVLLFLLHFLHLNCFPVPADAQKLTVRMQVDLLI